MASSSSKAQAGMSAPRCTTVHIEDWPPAGSLREVVSSRGRDFACFTGLQTALRLWHFTQRDFAALARVAPQHASVCQKLCQLEASRFSQSKLVGDVERLVRRLEGEKLQLIVIGALNAGKTTLINMLLTNHWEECYKLLPTNPKAVVVSVNGQEQWHSNWTQGGAVDASSKLRELSGQLQYHRNEVSQPECEVRDKTEIAVVS
mmetsp:Transcript_74031/g.171747  ORF Transcript_74031/g.171747 Transcript_74031/m.171747 type:complete len:204 (-) Transcript_74031:86-697(-)|eukprot:CAMPEP_0171102684 /NCGR_PEP_ID=MMETSP0766_2-20121228/58464_1 /TAXON_ID=439317 /ORGANISM="Gambierdiscus australes, Strain CAWD 149" /LENGTH=203 /DNA_ID=CAMNT_0011563019 /DNA_START=27 /DNA_END=638 /DNA_ORIENTATION=+